MSREINSGPYRTNSIGPYCIAIKKGTVTNLGQEWHFRVLNVDDGCVRYSGTVHSETSKAAHGKAMEWIMTSQYSDHNWYTTDVDTGEFLSLLGL